MANRKLYALYRIVLFRNTLSDPYLPQTTPRNHVVDRFQIQQGKGKNLGVVCLMGSLLWCTQKQANRSRYHLGLTRVYGPQKLCIEWAERRMNPFTARRVTRCCCRLVSRFIDHLFNFGAAKIISLEWVKLGLSNLLCYLIERRLM